ncbi:regulatory protein GemA [Gracilinema caldarium]|uniref:regulatory protein GemA n=1 Tax=Gracilinema caldarium TaxID=215591 RepID=UPI0026EF760A|nr:regulatory protein GemA [Gracilinema caldarium]
MDNLKKQTWIKLIHTARRQLALDDEAYRTILGAAGIESSKELSSEKQFDEIMQAFKNLGFKYQKKKEIILPNRASKAQIAYIKRLWDLGSRSKTESGLRQFLRRIGHVDDVNFLTKQQASAVILALEDILKKASKEAE